MRLSRQLEEALNVPTPYEMHVAHGMPLTPTFITKGRKGVEAKGTRLFLSRVGDAWRIDAKLRGKRGTSKTLEKKKDAYKFARKILGRLRDFGDDFVVNNGKRTWRVQAGDTLAYAAAAQGVSSFFKRGGP